MGLSPGTRLGVYEIVSLLGAGGMGEVYRARDTRLDRHVALKVLPEAMASDPERTARFQREAKVLASLNHPHIAGLFGLEEDGGRHLLTMELVEGETLADRIARGPIPLDEALPIATQIADALESAHEQGIIHRDLKPANIKLRTDGTVKVLDFGLAKALSTDSAVPSALLTNSPTITSPVGLTRVGVLLGTAPYMSPEQARGKPADKRSDVWAFGCVLYEMLTGCRAFEGEDVSDTVAAVLRGEPDWARWPATAPAQIRVLTESCLRKDRKVRVGDLSTARFVFDHFGNVPAASQTPSFRNRYRLAWSLVAATATVAGYAAWMLASASIPPRSVIRTIVPLGRDDNFSNLGVHVVALSANGGTLAYAANGRLYVRRLDQLAASPVRGTEGTGPAAGRSPFFSPDGQWLGFWQDGYLKKVSIVGGTPVALCDAENPWGANWTTDNTILYGQGREGRGGVWRVSANGGTPEHLVKVDAGEIAQRPQLLPGGGAILFTLARRDEWATAQVVVQSLGSEKRQVVLQHAADAQYVPTGHLVYATDGTLFAVPFDLTRLAVSGGAVPLIEDVAQGNVTAHFAISNEGALAYVPRDAVDVGLLGQRRTLVWVDRQGREEPIKAPPRRYFYPRLSPDGTRVAVEARDEENDIWIWDLSRQTLTRATFEPTFEQYGVWTPDGKSLIFGSSRLGGPSAPRNLLRRPSDGTGTSELLWEGSVAQFPSAVTPDGTSLIFRAEVPPSKPGAPPGTDLLLLPLTGDRRARPLVQTPFAELNGEVSPDGHWLAYQSNESGRHEIYVRPFPNVEGGKWPVSTKGGTQPLWAKSGQELFYESAGALLRVPVKIGSSFDAGAPSKLFDGPNLLVLPPGGGLGRMYDVTADGTRFVMIKTSGQDGGPDASARIILVQNWFEELKRRVPTH
jgi:serine/threonine-protein kinase